MLTLTAVFSAHTLPLLWYLSANHSHTAVVKPPLLTGVFVQQAASQATVAAAQSPTKSALPAQEPKPKPKPKQEKHKVPPQPEQNTVKPAIAATRQAEAGAATKPAPQPAVVAESSTAAVAAATDSAAASAVPVSAPLLNATAHFNAPPLYPQLSRKLREQGTVVLELTVLANGKVADVIVQQSSGYPRLDKAALLAVQHWRYQPAQRAGKALDYRYRQRVEFSLTEGVK